jgi:chromosomal replication initiator protein
MDSELIWEKTLSILKERLNVPTFKTMFQNTRLLSLGEDSIVVGTPNQFIKEWLETRHATLIKEAFSEVLGKSVNIRLVITPQTPEYKEDYKEERVTSEELGKLKSDEITSYTREGLFLNPRYTFETFVVGAGNRFAHAAALAVAERPAFTYNPLFIYGDTGLGKTHLLQAIAHYVLEYHQNLKVCYVTSETFTNQFINAVRDKNILSFQRRYRETDVLLIDDIQFLAGKEQTQEEFFHTFNTLYEAGKQIVISSDRSPKEISPLEGRLRSRFEWGLITDIQPPDLETRIAILRKKAQIQQLSVPNEVLEFIASRIKSNIRELEGALNRVKHYSTLTRRPITLPLAEEVLKNIYSEADNIIKIDHIINEICNFYSISKSDLLSNKRTQNISYPRQVAMYLCRELTDLSLPRIGREFNGRDHTTVLHAYNKISNLMSKDNRTFNEIQELIARIKRNCR